MPEENVDDRIDACLERLFTVDDKLFTMSNVITRIRNHLERMRVERDNDGNITKPAKHLDYPYEIYTDEERGTACTALAAEVEKLATRLGVE